MNERGLVITIDRQYDNGGRIIGKGLPEELGIPSYDQEILKMAPEESAVGEQFFRLNDKKVRSNLTCRAIGGLRSSPQELSVEEGAISPKNLSRLQAKTIGKVADESPCIIMGRCADCVLDVEAREQSARLFVYADISICTRKVVEVDGMDAKEALKRVNRISKECRDYYRYYTGKDWEGMANYDLPINITRLELDEAMTLIEDHIKIGGCEL